MQIQVFHNNVFRPLPQRLIPGFTSTHYKRDKSSGRVINMHILKRESVYDKNVTIVLLVIFRLIFGEGWCPLHLFRYLK
jgi:hypothetical protein